MEQHAACLGWVALDEDDNDLVQFVSYLAAALVPATPGLKAAVQDISAAGDIPPKRVATALINALSQSERQVMLVLDDYHLIQAPEVHELLDLLLARAPDTFHCMLLARRTPPLALSRLRVQGQLLTLGVEDLKFTLGESQAFFAAALPEPLSEGELALVSERMDGWGAGMQLAALALRETINLNQSSAYLPLEREMVTEYIVTEILERLPADLRQFLLQTSILDVLTAPLCQAVTQQPDSLQLLGQVTEATALVTQLDTVQGAYRYHHLLRHVLGNQLEQRTTLDERNELHRRAAAWYAEAGDVDSALRHFEQGDATQAAIHLVERYSLPAMLRGDTLAVERWFARLPAQAMGERPRLALNLAWLSLILERTDMDDRLLLVRQALAVPSAEQPEDSWPYEVLVLDACAAYYRTQAATVLQLSQQALEKIPAQYSLERGVCHLLRLIYYRQHHIIEDSMVHADQAITNFIRAGFDIGVMSTMRTKALIYFDTGRAAEAVQTFHRQLEFAHSTASYLGIEIAYSLLDYGITLYLLNRLSEAQQQFEELLALARRIDDQVFVLCSTFWLRLCARARSPQAPIDHTDYADTERMLCELIATRSPALSWQVLRAGVWLRLREHNPASAWTSVQCASFNVHQEPSIDKAVWFLTYAHAYLGRGRGLAALTPIMQRWEGLLEGQAGVVSLKIQFRILAALLYSTQGNHMGATKALDEALARIAPSGYVRFVLDHAEQLHSLLLRSNHPLAQAILAEVEAVTQQAPAPLLSEIELRVLRHTAAGLTRQQTATALFLSENTVKTHLKRIYAKFGAASRDAALTRARELGLLDA